VKIVSNIIEQVEEYKFLGSIKTANGDCTKEIKKSIAMAKEKLLGWKRSGNHEIEKHS